MKDNEFDISIPFEFISPSRQNVKTSLHHICHAADVWNGIVKQNLAPRHDLREYHELIRRCETQFGMPLSYEAAKRIMRRYDSVDNVVVSCLI